MKRLFMIGLPAVLLLALSLAGCGGKTQYALNITIENGPGCSVTPASGTTYPAGTVVELTAIGATGYVLDHWGGTDGASVTADNMIAIDGDKHVVAVFAKLQYDLAVEASPAAGGTVETVLALQPQSVYGIEHGQTVQLTARPNPGYVFDHWEGGLTGNSNPATLTLNGPPTQSVTACFTPGIHGHVLGAKSLRGFAGITITASGGLTATTDADGYWQIKGVSFPVTVTASASAASGYLGAVFSPAWVTVRAISDADIRMAVSTYVYERSWGEYGSLAGYFSSPSGIAVDRYNSVYVADTGNNRIQKYSSSGTYLAAWGSSGSGNGQFSNPYGVTADTDGYVYVADADNNRIQKFKADGTYQSQWGSFGSGNGQFISPVGVTVDTTGNVYVVEKVNHRIQKFKADGIYLSKWGSMGHGDGQFIFPCGVTVDTTGYVYVADTTNNRIQKFKADGTYLSQWGSYGSGNGQFSSPNGVMVDTAGYVYVADTGNHRIQKFKADGTYLSQWGSSGTGNDQFSGPCGVAVDAAGYVYVSDQKNHRIQVFRPVD